MLARSFIELARAGLVAPRADGVQDWRVIASEQLPSDNRNFRELAGVAKALSEFVALPFRPDAPSSYGPGHCWSRCKPPPSIRSAGSPAALVPHFGCCVQISQQVAGN
jgi:hypothetical protein